MLIYLRSSHKSRLYGACTCLHAVARLTAPLNAPIFPKIYSFKDGFEEI